MPTLNHPTSPLTETAIGYAAGFLDGEGSLTITTAGRYQFIYLSFFQAERGLDALKYIQAHFGGSINRHDRVGGFRSEQGQTMWVLGIRSQGQVRRCLEATTPHLIIKKEKAERALMLLVQNGRHQTFWLPEEDAILVDNYGRGKVAALAVRLERSHQAVWGRMKTLKHRHLV